MYATADVSVYAQLKEFAASNREHPTQAESIMWELLKEKQLGVSFRRQHIIGQFIVDFACLKQKLVIEIDGRYHQLPEQEISDSERTQWLEAQGLTVLRFTNEEVIGNTSNVIDKIKQSLFNN